MVVSASHLCFVDIESGLGEHTKPLLPAAGVEPAPGAELQKLARFQHVLQGCHRGDVLRNTRVGPRRRSTKSYECGYSIVEVSA